jgi:hypothetical protein
MTTSVRAATRTPSRGTVRFVGHYFEMVLAMLVGMMALAPLWSLAAPEPASVAADAIVMATTMTLGMAAWMLIRRHSWPRIAEMSAVMYLPFVLLLVPYGLGAISGDILMVAGHVVMFPLMLAAMIWRRDDYRH